MTITDNVLPRNLEAEQAVLGSITYDSNCLLQVRKILETPKAFYNQGHRIIYKHMLTLYEKGLDIDVVTLVNSLTLANELDQVGGREYLSALSDHSPTSSHAISHAETVKDMFMRRLEIELGQKIQDSANKSEDDYTKRQEALFAACNAHCKNTGFNNKLEHISEPLSRCVELLSSNESSLKTHYSGIDAICSGLRKGNMYVIAGRPGSGKTSLALNLAYNIAKSRSGTVAIFSLEMSAEEIAFRYASMETKLDGSQLRQADFKQDGSILKKIEAGVDSLPLYVCDQAKLNTNKIKLFCEGWMAIERKKLDLIVIDYLQLLDSNEKSSNETEKITQISRDVKLLAKELDVPILVLSQLSRTLESRPNKRPMLSDLRSSGAIEQDADVVILLYQDEYYNPNSEDKGQVEIIIAKNRSGPVGTVWLAFHKETTSFGDL